MNEEELNNWITENEDICMPLLEAIWIMRWNDNKTAMSAVLTENEANQMCKDVVEELDKAGFKIVKKDKN